MPLALAPLATRLIGLQVGKEVTWGTSVVATAKMMGVQPVPQFTPKIKSTIFDEQRGTVVPGYLSAILMKGGGFSFNTFVTYEDILFLLEGAVKGGITPTGTNPYTWTYPAPVTAYTPWNARSYTFEFGYDLGSIFASGCLIEKLSLKGEANKPIEANVSGFYKTHNTNAGVAIQSSTNASPIVVTTAVAHNIPTGAGVSVADHLVNTAANGLWVANPSAGTTMTLVGSTGNGIGANTGYVHRALTPSLVDRTAEIAIVPTTALYIDTAAGTVGTTLFDSQMASFQIDIETGLKPVYTAGYLEPTSFTYDKYNVSLSLTLLWTNVVKNMLTTGAYTGLGNQIRLLASSAPKSMTLDFAGVLTDDPKLYDNRDAAQVVTLKFDAIYNAQLANFFKAVVINPVSTLP